MVSRRGSNGHVLDTSHIYKKLSKNKFKIFFKILTNRELFRFQPEILKYRQLQQTADKMNDNHGKLPYLTSQQDMHIKTTVRTTL